MFLHFIKMLITQIYLQLLKCLLHKWYNCTMFLHFIKMLVYIYIFNIYIYTTCLDYNTLTWQYHYWHGEEYALKKFHQNDLSFLMKISYGASHTKNYKSIYTSNQRQTWSHSMPSMPGPRACNLTRHTFFKNIKYIYVYTNLPILYDFR